MTRPVVSLVVGARPNFVKIGSLYRSLTGLGHFEIDLVHTGQHYTGNMSDAFFDDLDLPQPTVNLGVGSGRHGEQTARVLIGYERYLLDRSVQIVVVVGDVNSTLGAALAAAKLGVSVAHVEAGLRSHDWTMPEEINRVLTDRLAEWLFVPTEADRANLLAEGLGESRIHLVGNIMIDALREYLPRAKTRLPQLRDRYNLSSGYCLVTLHRPHNVDDLEQLKRVCRALTDLSERLPIIFPVHPRTEARIRTLLDQSSGRLQLTKPLGYLDFVALMSGAALVITDSGGIQEETSALGVPCLTVRPNTERPVTCLLGTNRLVGTEPHAIVEAANTALSQSWEPARIPLWDGETAGRIAAVLMAGIS